MTSLQSFWLQLHINRMNMFFTFYLISKIQFVGKVTTETLFLFSLNRSIKGGCLCVCVYVCLSVTLKQQPLVKVGEGIAEDPRECNVECEFGRMSGSGELYQSAPNGLCSEWACANGQAHAQNGHTLQTGTALVMKEPGMLTSGKLSCSGCTLGQVSHSIDLHSVVCRWRQRAHLKLYHVS